MQLSAAGSDTGPLRHLAALGPGPLGVAVSGGSDSLALLHLAVEAGHDVRAVTVDHGLRPEAAAEAAAVGRLCETLGVPHAVLRWTGWDGRGNRQDMARRARYGLMADWAAGAAVTRIALGHTLDDQAETFLMRLGRRAGLDGLSAMAAERRALGVVWLRPLLAVRRAALRDWLLQRGISWADDPGNTDLRQERVRARALLQALAPMGLDAAALAEVAGHLRAARVALEAQMHAAMARLVTAQAGDLMLSRDGLAAELPEIRRRILSQALCLVASAEYGPRAAALARAETLVLAGRPAALHGCLLRPARGAIRVLREPRAVAATVAEPGALWDGRWRLIPQDSGTLRPGLEVRALGEAGLSACPGARDTGLPRLSLLGLPAVWRGADLVAAPLAGRPEGWRAELSQRD